MSFLSGSCNNAASCRHSSACFLYSLTARVATLVTTNTTERLTINLQSKKYKLIF